MENINYTKAKDTLSKRKGYNSYEHFKSELLRLSSGKTLQSLIDELEEFYNEAHNITNITEQNSQEYISKPGDIPWFS